MKKIIGLSLLLFFTVIGRSQSLFTVTNLSGTTTYGCTDVTVTNSPWINPEPECIGGPTLYEIGAGDIAAGGTAISGSYTFNFSHPIARIKSHIAVIGPHEYVALYINHSTTPYPLTVANMISYADACHPGTASPNPPIGGEIYGSGTSYTADEFKHTEIDISGLSATSVEVYCSGGSAGVLFDFQFASAEITGSSTVCTGSTISLSTTATGGSWSSSDPTKATVGSSTGIVHGVSAGVATITYTYGSCYATTNVTVNTTPAITGASGVCVGSTQTLSGSVSGGTWSSTVPAVATIGSSTGIVTGVNTGTTMISYSVGGCTATRYESVYAIPPPITGPASICVGWWYSTYLSDPSGAGTWTSSNTGVATIGSSSGAITGVSSGTTTITFKTPLGCTTSEVVTVNPSPSPITGPTSLCVGGSITLSDIPTGGTWSTFDPTITLGSSTGIVTGIATGLAAAQYTLSTGCYRVVLLTVNPTPSSILGPTSLCLGGAITLSDPSTGGMWSSSNSGIADVGSGSGIVTGLSLGIATITYDLSSGCNTSTTVTVDPAPPAITGLTTVCVGQTIIESDGALGGIWSSSNPVIATIGSSSGTVNGVSPGSTIITYSLPGGGCFVQTTVTVDPPAIISGPSHVCMGNSITLTDADAGGIWTSSNMSIATVGSSTGVVTGVISGVVTISYSIPGYGCSMSYLVTVDPLPSPISGPTTICTGSSITLSDAVGGGAWGSSNTGIATVGSATGIVTSVGLGVVTISYAMPGGCYAAATVTVNAPPPISGPSTICVGSSVALSDALSGGVWSSSLPGVATIGSGSGIVSGVSSGTAIITYGLSSGCFAVVPVIVNATPPPITGSLSVCVGSTSALGDAEPGGTWSSSHITVASISSSGIVTGYTVGTATITYTSGYSGHCFTTATVTVNPLPSPISGSYLSCVGDTYPISDPDPGGIWSSSRTSVATVGSLSGDVTAVSAGSAIITYTLPTGCFTTMPVSVIATPPPIVGPSTICVGEAVTYTDPLTGGLWFTSSPVLGLSTYAGYAIGMSPGVATLTYIDACPVSMTVTVLATPAPITGSSGVCGIGTSSTYTDATPGGIWSSSNPAVGTIDASGTFTSIASGLTTISYTSPTTGCAATLVVGVYGTPPAITGSGSMCVGSSVTFTDAGFGYWSSSDPTIASIGSASGIAIGLATGTATISYTLSTGCVVTFPVTVNPVPLPVAGSVPTCAGSALTLTDPTTGGTWASTSTGIAVVDPALGIVTGVSGGTATISYTLSTGCAATTDVTINPLPGAIGGSLVLCDLPSTGIATDPMPGGTWSSSDPSIVTVNATSGTMTGISYGTATITYALGTGCFTTAVVSVNPSPALITGVFDICLGSTDPLMDITPPGTWSSNDPSIAPVDPATGVVTGTALGTATITYTRYGCPTTATVTVSAVPATITGPGTVCEGSTITLADATPGGIWMTPPPVASIGASSGVLSGLSAGVAFVLYDVPGYCLAMANVTVNPLPAAIGGPSAVCVGSTITLADAIVGGTWSSSDVAIGSIDPATGIFTGISGGSVTITYTLPTGCYVVTAVTVNPLPGVIAGPSGVCVGATILLSDPDPGGTWSSSDVTIASIGSLTGTVTGIAPGIVTITYKLASGCVATYSLTVDPPPVITLAGSSTAITTVSVCISATVSLDATPAGGSWSSSDPTIGSVDPVSGVVSGILSGTTIVTYTLPSGCYSTVTAIVPGPAFAAGTTPYVCLGATTTLSATPPGGVWSSGDPTIADVGSSSGIVTGVAAGTVPISYSVTVGGCMGIGVLSFTVDPIPVMSPNPAMILCTSLTLTSGGPGTSPAGVTPTYTWSPSAGLASTTGGSVSCIGPLPPGLTIYTITCTDMYGCSSTGLDTVVVMDCAPQVCHTMGDPIYAIAGDIMGFPVTLGPASYYAYDDITFHGDVTLLGDVIAIAPGKTFYVDPRSSLSVSNSHLFSCSDNLMWNGIVLQSDPVKSISARCTINKYSLIEDAITGVLISDGYAPDGAGMLFTSDGAIFNRNMTGISINRYPAGTPSVIPGTPAGFQYPFLIQNTVFTSRDFRVFNDGINSYPLAWPQTDGTPTSLVTIPATWSPAYPFQAPYNIDNPNAAGPGVRYAYITCKNSLPADIGIALNFVGEYRYLASGPAAPAAFAQIYIGGHTAASGLTNMNLFDSLHYGINAQYSNVTAFNNGFIHMYSPCPGCAVPPPGAGVNTYNSLPLPAGIDPIHSICQLQLILDPLTRRPATNNKFYDCIDGVKSVDNYYVNATGNAMYSNHGIFGASPVSGTYGFDISSWKYFGINVSNNSLQNIYNTGIFIASGVGTGGSVLGTMHVNNNAISVPYSGYPWYMENAIYVSNVTLGSPSTAVGQVQINNNNISGVLNGITALNFNSASQAAISNNNTITLVPNTGGIAGVGPLQYGIQHSQCLNNVISNNTITGPGASSPTISTSVYFPGSRIAGVVGTINSGAQVSCNTINYTNTGFEFGGAANYTTWVDNTMHRNAIGMALWGEIGPQGNTATPSDNIWVGPTGWFDTYGASSCGITDGYTTADFNLFAPTLSPLNVRSGGSYISGPMIYDPPNNWASPITYAYGSGSWFGPTLPAASTAAPLPPCEITWTTRMALRPARTSIAQQHAGYVTNVSRNYWMAQKALWDAIVRDTTIIDSSAELTQFRAMTTGSRYAWLNNIENALVIGDYTTASGLLAAGIDTYIDTAVDTVTGVVIADGLAADTVVRHYTDFYHVFLDYKTGVLSYADTCKLNYLAHLCPRMDGAIVYEARGLYALVNDAPGVYFDNCTDSSGDPADTCRECAYRKGHMADNSRLAPVIARDNNMQQYFLFPNPNEGTFAIRQHIADQQPVAAEIMDAAGRVVYRNTLLFAGREIQIQTNGLAAGMYMLNLVDNDGKKFSFKFVIEK